MHDLIPFTLDGTDPVLGSPLYEAGFQLTAEGPAVFRVRAFKNNYAPSNVVEVNYTIEHMAMGELSVGGAHTCAISSHDKLFCWGSNFYGELGRGYSSYIFTPTEVISPPLN